MIHKLRNFCVFSILAASSSLYAAESVISEVSPSVGPLRTHRFQPCAYWRMDTSSGTYTCVYTNNTIEVTDAQDVAQMQRTIVELQRTIEALDARVKVLEGNN